MFATGLVGNIYHIAPEQIDSQVFIFSLQRKEKKRKEKKRSKRKKTTHNQPTKQTKTKRLTQEKSEISGP